MRTTFDLDYLKFTGYFNLKNLLADNFIIYYLTIQENFKKGSKFLEKNEKIEIF